MRGQRIRRLSRRDTLSSRGRPPFGQVDLPGGETILTPEQRVQIRAAAVEHFRSNVGKFKEAGAVLSETDGGWVKAEFVIGDEAVPTLRYPKKQLADDKWTAGTLRNLDAAITKAQMNAEIAAAIAQEPL